MTTVAVEKEEVPRISSMCNFSYPARTANLPNILSPVVCLALSHFSKSSHIWHDFRKKKVI